LINSHQSICLSSSWRININEILNVFLLSLLAGLGTGVGGLIAVIRKPGKRMFGFLMGFAAGVMISLSFLSLVNEAWRLKGFLTATIGFAAGAFFMLIMDMTLPHIRFGEREASDDGSTATQEANIRFRGHRHQHGRFRRHNQITDRPLYMTGVLLTLGITIHNLPEGIAVGAGYMHTPTFGFYIAMAILLHNIPEGIATALPLCASGVCKWDSFRAAFFSGLVEPIGALVAGLFLSAFDTLIPGALAFAGGVMMFITLDELIPAAREHGHQHYTAIGIILGSIFVFLLSGIFGV
jgi:ZIP family zinc transporter